MGAFAYDGPAHGPAAGARLGSGISDSNLRRSAALSLRGRRRNQHHIGVGRQRARIRGTTCGTCVVHVQYEGERYAPNYSYTRPRVPLTVLAKSRGCLLHLVFCFWFSLCVASGPNLVLGRLRPAVCCRSHLLKIALLLPARSVRVRIRGSRAHAGDGARTRHALPSPLAASLRTLSRRTLCSSPIGVTRRSHLARSSPSAWPAAPLSSPPRDGNRY